MTNKQSYNLEEPFLQQEIFLGMVIGIGMLLMVVSETFGMLMVFLGIASVTGIYIWRIAKSIVRKGEAVKCCFYWINNGIMILAAAGILLLMLLNAFHRPVFYAVLALLSVGLLLNGIFLRYDIRGLAHITAQIRLVIALVLLVVFFLL